MRGGRQLRLLPFEPDRRNKRKKWLSFHFWLWVGHLFLNHWLVGWMADFRPRSTPAVVAPASPSTSSSVGHHTRRGRSPQRTRPPRPSSSRWFTFRSGKGPAAGSKTSACARHARCECAISCGSHHSRSSEFPVIWSRQRCLMTARDPRATLRRPCCRQPKLLFLLQQRLLLQPPLTIPCRRCRR